MPKRGAAATVVPGREVRRKINVPRYVVIDIETTGFDGEAKPVDYPIQFAAVAYDPSDQSICMLVDAIISGAASLNAWVKANVPVTMEDVSRGMPLPLVVNLLASMLRKDDVLVMHGAKHDWEKVMVPHGNANEILGKHTRICTMTGNIVKGSLSDRLPKFPNGKPKWPSLSELSAALAVSVDPLKQHSALYDATLLANCVEAAFNQNLRV